MALLCLLFFFALLYFLLGFHKDINSSPNVVYSVYLDGKAIGTIASKDSFEEYINSKEEELKKISMMLILFILLMELKLKKEYYL